MKGTYCLVIEVPSDLSIDSTALGNLEFKKGFWVYIGSAQGLRSTNLSNRLKRHFRKEKKIHWHIDHLLASNANLVDAIWAKSPRGIECVIAQYLEKQEKFIWGPTGFGSSDCTESCKSHILFFQGGKQPIRKIEDAFNELNMIPRRYSKFKPTSQ